MKYLRPIIWILLCLGFFIYGIISVTYKVFPYRQMMAVKLFITHKQNQDQSTEKVNTFLQRLLIKKVYLNEDLFRGGGITNIEDYIIVSTNKGKLLVFDNANYQKLNGYIQDIPMNMDKLLRTEFSERDDFRLEWFRVSGIYADMIDAGKFRVFVTHHWYNEESECVEHRISRMNLEIILQDSIKTNQPWKTIFSAEPCIRLNPENYSSREPYVGHLGGGRIIEYNDSTLMVTVGDYDRNGLNNTQKYSFDLTVPYGKIILVNKNTGAWSIYAYGVRNPMGLYKSENGIIWETENGPRGGDELNRIEKGKNYGWPDESYGIWYIDKYKLGGDARVRGTHINYVKPIFSWVPSIAPNNLARIEGDKFEYWKGDLIIGTMKDKSIHRVRLSEDNSVVYTERIPLGHRVRDLKILNDEKIALITDDGFLIIIDDGGSVYDEISPAVKQRIAEMDLYNGFTSGSISKDDNPHLAYRANTARAIFVRHCGNCHYKSEKNSIGPHLNDLFGRTVGSLQEFNYSTALMNDDRSWSPSLLRRFLLEPEIEFPNNLMTKVNLSDSEVDSIIIYLEK